jgi:hypothetical protein
MTESSRDQPRHEGSHRRPTLAQLGGAMAQIVSTGLLFGRSDTARAGVVPAVR